MRPSLRRSSSRVALRLAFALACSSCISLGMLGASADAAAPPPLFGAHPPRGMVLADNALTWPGVKPKGIVMIIHGGSWFFTGPKTLAGEVSNVAWFTHIGWAVYDVDYRPGWLSVVDVIAAYDHLRRQHPRAAICVYGESVGGQLAMLLAASRSSLRCVISAGGITDLREIPRSSALYGFAQRVFHWHLRKFSPVRWAGDIRGGLLCAGSSFDEIVPQPAQLGAIRRARPQTRVMLLPGAPTPGGVTFTHPPNFVHASVTAAALRRYRRVVRRMLAHAVARADRLGDPS